MIIKEIDQNKGKICEDILRSLNDWFGIEEATKAYIKGVEDTLFLIACDNEKPVGFISLKKHYSFSYEIYVMGIYKEYHNRGIGSRLVRQAERLLKEKGAKFLQVKTLSENRPNKFYDKTRTFYLKNSFTPLEEFKTLWDEFNPCLLLVKNL